MITLPSPGVCYFVLNMTEAGPPRKRRKVGATFGVSGSRCDVSLFPIIYSNSLSLFPSTLSSVLRHAPNQTIIIIIRKTNDNRSAATKVIILCAKFGKVTVPQVELKLIQNALKLRGIHLSRGPGKLDLEVFYLNVFNLNIFQNVQIKYA